MLKKKDLFWGVASNVSNAGLWLGIVPLAARFLDAQEIALWLSFVVLSSVGTLLEMGFNPTISRSYSYVLGGAQSLKVIGVDTNSGIVNQKLLAELVVASKIIYRIIGILTGLLLWIGGSLYVAIVLPAETSILYALSSWLVFSSATIISFYFGYTNALIIGRGDIGLYNRILFWTRAVQMVGSVVGILLGGGLFSLCLVAVISSILNRIYSYRIISDESRFVRECDPSAYNVKNLVKTLFPNASRYGFVIFGAFLIGRANILLAGFLLGVVEASGFNFSMQIFSFIQSVATLPFNVVSPSINLMWAQGRMKDIPSVFGYVLILGLASFAVAAIIYVCFGSIVLNAIGANIILPSNLVLLIMFITFLLELNHGICANLLTIDNKIPFVFASLFTGAAIISASFIVTPIFGLLGMVCTIFLCQIVYNNWKWPREAGKLLQSDYFNLLYSGIVSFKEKAVDLIVFRRN